MRTPNKTMLIITMIAVPTLVSAQTYFSNTLGTAMIRSDSTNRSALISNLIDKRGDRSQLLGTGFIQSKEDVMECRSFLAFDMNKLPAFLSAEQISSAKLILFPLRMEDEAAGMAQATPAEIMVKRVTGTWEDSLIKWDNQPAVDEERTVTKKIRAKELDKPAEIEVTKLVKKMLKEGNHGFVISSFAPKTGDNGDISWFGSSRNRAEGVRPVLLLEYAKLKPAAGTPYRDETPLVGMRVAEMDDMYRRAVDQYRLDRIPNPIRPVAVENTPVVNPGGKDKTPATTPPAQDPWE